MKFNNQYDAKMWEYGEWHGMLARRHKQNKNVQYLSEEANPSSWVDAHQDYWIGFIPNKGKRMDHVCSLCGNGLFERTYLISDILGSRFCTNTFCLLNSIPKKQAKEIIEYGFSLKECMIYYPNFKAKPIREPKEIRYISSEGRSDLIRFRDKLMGEFIQLAKTEKESAIIESRMLNIDKLLFDLESIIKRQSTGIIFSNNQNDLKGL